MRGSGPPVAHGPAAGPRATVAEGSGNAFAKDVHAAVLVTAALCASGAAPAATGLRRGPVVSGR